MITDPFRAPQPTNGRSFTSEAVSPGHPDKLCDRISDAILDAFLDRDPEARVACEAVAAHGKILVTGEFRTADPTHHEDVRAEAEAIVRSTVRSVGYGTAEHDIDPDGCEVEIRFNHQSDEISEGVDGGQELGAGDQGMMFGFATAETPSRMPWGWALATDLVAKASELRASPDSPLRPDGKSQVTVRYVDGEPVSVDAVVLSWQHAPDIDVATVRSLLAREVIDEIVPRSVRSDGFRCLVNPAGPWTSGGPKGDTGLTGRKIIVDTYGGTCPHGGGAFSGKDPSKVDRSGAYAARWIAKNVVEAGLARRCTVQLAYAIGVAEPVSVTVDLHDTSEVTNSSVEQAIRETFDLSPAGIIRDLHLLRPIYTPTSSLGHFGRWRDPEIHRWERTDRVDRLRRAAGLSAPFASSPECATIDGALHGTEVD